MADKPSLEEVAATLFPKLEACATTTDERALLDMILTFARDVMRLESAFAESFEPGSTATTASATGSIINQLPLRVTHTTTIHPSPPAQ